MFSLRVPICLCYSSIQTLPDSLGSSNYQSAIKT